MDQSEWDETKRALEADLADLVKREPTATLTDYFWRLHIAEFIMDLLCDKGWKSPGELGPRPVPEPPKAP